VYSPIEKKPGSRYYLENSSWVRRDAKEYMSRWVAGLELNNEHLRSRSGSMRATDVHDIDRAVLAVQQPLACALPLKLLQFMQRTIVKSTS
jgi:hypothetical protein